jgi:hypothetical protein
VKILWYNIPGPSKARKSFPYPLRSHHIVRDHVTETQRDKYKELCDRLITKSQDRVPGVALQPKKRDQDDDYGGDDMGGGGSAEMSNAKRSLVT